MKSSWIAIVLLCLLAMGCGKEIKTVPAVADDGKSESSPLDEDLSKQPRHIKVQHILIAFKGSIPGKPNVTRSKEEAKALAEELLQRARSGQDFTSLVEHYTDDSAPGYYRLANYNVPTKGGPMANRPDSEKGRANMVKAFGDVSFSLKKGEFGLAEYDENDSPYGWHIIKRIE